MDNGAGPDEEVQRILNTGWRTARLCAHETYMDCPFYEQLQYGGDARIQMLVSLYTTGDAQPDAQRHRAARFHAQCRRPDVQPRALRAGAVHSAVLALVGRDGARLPDVHGRPRVRAANAARRARGAQLLRRLSESRAARWSTCRSGISPIG